MKFLNIYLKQQNEIKEQQSKYYDEYEKRNELFQKEYDSGLYHSELLNQLNQIKKNKFDKLSDVAIYLDKTVDKLALKIDKENFKKNNLL